MRCSERVNDQWYHFAYDTKWRMVATFRADDNDPKEQFLYHQAGSDGRGGSSYIDAVVLRQKDDNSGWTSAADGTLEQRYYLAGGCGGCGFGFGAI